MLDTVRDRLREIYNGIMERINSILQMTIDQFGEEFVDSTIISFDDFLVKLQSYTLGNLEISEYQASNDYGSYSIDKEDYEKNGRGKKFLDYIPDLGILDYLKPEFRSILLQGQGNSITIHWPEVRVTNEYDKFVDIQDLYARFFVLHNGALHNKFQMLRATLPFSHYRAGYAHSHLPGIYSDNVGLWQDPCTGTGPINATMETLRHGYDEHIWGLFIYELSKYVTIESIAGTPYRRLETIGKGDLVGLQGISCRNSMGYQDVCKDLFDKFIYHYAGNHKFKLKYCQNQYQLGENNVSAIIHMSNDFINWYNNNAPKMPTAPPVRWMQDHSILSPYIVSGCNIYSVSSDMSQAIQTARRLNGKRLFNFKGKPVTLQIQVSDNFTENTSLLLSKEVCEYIITKILSIINYEYGKKRKTEPSYTGQATREIKVDPNEKSYII